MKYADKAKDIAARALGYKGLEHWRSERTKEPAPQIEVRLRDALRSLGARSLWYGDTQTRRSVIEDRAEKKRIREMHRRITESTSPQELERLVYSGYKFAEYYVASNVHTSAVTLDLLVMTSTETARELDAMDPEERKRMTLGYLMYPHWVLAEAARNPNLSPEAQEFIAKSRLDHSQLLDNPNVTAQAVRILENDPDERIRSAARGRFDQIIAALRDSSTVETFLEDLKGMGRPDR